MRLLVRRGLLGAASKRLPRWIPEKPPERNLLWSESGLPREFP
jgi:hypothetical protein